MPKGRRGRSPSQSFSLSQISATSRSESEEVSEHHSPPRRQKNQAKSGKAHPVRGRGPPRRASMRGEWPESDEEEEKPRRSRPNRRPTEPSRRPKKASKESNSDHDAREYVDDEEVPSRRRPTKAKRQPLNEEAEVEPRRARRDPPAAARRQQPSPVEFDPIEPDASIEGTDDQTRQAPTANHEESQTAQPPEEDSFEEQLRKAIEASKADEVMDQQVSAVRYAEPDDEKLREALEESQRTHEEQERQRAEKEYALAIKESQRAARASGFYEDEDDLAKAIRLSEAAAAEDIRRAAERMAIGRNTSTSTASWTEDRLASRDRGSSEAEASPATPPASTEANPTPAAKPAKPKRGVTQSIRESLSIARKPSTKRKSTTQRSENATASSSTPKAKAKAKATTNTPAAIPKDTKPLPSRPSQALITLREPPIKPETLISMCEAAFPRDPGISAALAASKASYAISSVQTAEEVSDPDLAAAVEASLRSHQENEDGALDIQETGLDDPPPSYFGSEGDKVVNHFRYTSSDYRREQPGKRKPITEDVFKIMRLYKELLAFYAEIEALDASSKGKGKETLALPAPNTSSSGDGKEKENESTEPDPPETIESLIETSRPALRPEAEIAAVSPSAARFMETLPPSARGAVARMQMQSQLVSQSKLPGSRPRQKPESHMRVMGRLPIVREEGASQGGTMGRGTARKIQKNSSYRRSGLGL
ncbi:MAG: hypothetical protein L6R41_003442 [Letrouitia leprolyta]|nr:MAG: hypothetical protein L6R41_003442 [Letrouitia leprolyta]